MNGLTKEQKKECISVLTTDMLISAFQSTDKTTEESILLLDELHKRLGKVDPSTIKSRGYITAERINRNGKKSIRIRITDHNFDTLYAGEMELAEFAEFVQGCETRIRREE